jgi:hypothetical protein
MKALTTMLSPIHNWRCVFLALKNFIAQHVQIFFGIFIVILLYVQAFVFFNWFHFIHFLRNFVHINIYIHLFSISFFLFAFLFLSLFLTLFGYLYSNMFFFFRKKVKILMLTCSTIFWNNFYCKDRENKKIKIK